jgi:hypothetical protein
MSDEDGRSLLGTSRRTAHPPTDSQGVVWRA